MERLGDDELLYIFDKIPYYCFQDRRSFLQVSKQCMKIACVRLRYLHNSFPDLLFDILPSSANMKSFTCSKPLSNTHLKLLAQCHKLHSLVLTRDLHKSESDTGSDSMSGEFDIDFDDDGLRAVANACIHLRAVLLNKRLHVGDAGVLALAKSCKNLTLLNLEGCVKITDESLNAIRGLAILALSLRGYDRITDNGIIHLKQMVHLIELNLSNSGVHITDSGIVPLVSHLSHIKKLDLSWLINVTDVSLVAIGSKCLKLENLFLNGCEAITSEGLHGFTGQCHQTLKKLLLFSCYNFRWEDVESVALTCVKLEYFGLMKRIKTPAPEENESFFEMRGRSCKIDWDVYTDGLFWN